MDLFIGPSDEHIAALPTVTMNGTRVSTELADRPELLAWGLQNTVEAGSEWFGWSVNLVCTECESNWSVFYLNILSPQHFFPKYLAVKLQWIPIRSLLTLVFPVTRSGAYIYLRRWFKDVSLFGARKTHDVNLVSPLWSTNVYLLPHPNPSLLDDTVWSLHEQDVGRLISKFKFFPLVFNKEKYLYQILDSESFAS